MPAVAFDTLKLARKLRDHAQMSQEQAEGVADALVEAMSGAELATRADIAALHQEIVDVRGEMATKADVARLEERIERRGAEGDARMIKWVVGTGVGAVLAIAGLLKVMVH